VARATWTPPAGAQLSFPARSLAHTGACLTTSGILIHQTGPDGEITHVPVLSFTPQPAHPSTGDCWAEVMYFSGRTELPLAAVVSFTPDLTVRERWNAAFARRRMDPEPTVRRQVRCGVCPLGRGVAINAAFAT
jgi:hypothetical protein